MNKMEYRRPQADLVCFENEDIITTSWWLEKCKLIGENRTDDCEYGGAAHGRLDNQFAVKCTSWNPGDSWVVKSGHEWGEHVLCGLLFEN